jgi:hypothetical protein
MYKSVRKAFKMFPQYRRLAQYRIDEMEESARKVMETISARTLLLVDIHKNLL